MGPIYPDSSTNIFGIYRAWALLLMRLRPLIIGYMSGQMSGTKSQKILHKIGHFLTNVPKFVGACQPCICRIAGLGHSNIGSTLDQIFSTIYEKMLVIMSHFQPDMPKFLGGMSAMHMPVSCAWAFRQCLYVGPHLWLKI